MINLNDVNVVREGRTKVVEYCCVCGGKIQKGLNHFVIRFEGECKVSHVHEGCCEDPTRL